MGTIISSLKIQMVKKVNSIFLKLKFPFKLWTIKSELKYFSSRDDGRRFTELTSFKRENDVTFLILCESDVWLDEFKVPWNFMNTESFLRFAGEWLGFQVWSCEGSRAFDLPPNQSLCGVCKQETGSTRSRASFTFKVCLKKSFFLKFQVFEYYFDLSV